MATYKVIQDVEAEDKLLGPLTLRQFIYGAVTSVCLYLSYLFTTHSAAFMLVVFLPIAAVCAFFAFPWRRDQPTEVWALAKIRFLLKPRRRIWDQSGAKELVTITAPKQIAVDYTNGLSQSEVRSRLHALATTIDTRGWAVKNSNINVLTQNSGMESSDRLIGPALLPKPVDDTGIQASDDILDEQNNASAQRLQTMIDQKTKSHHDELMATLSQPAVEPPKPAAAPKTENYWFLNQPAPSANIPSNMVTFNTQVVTPGAEVSDSSIPAAPNQDESGLLAELETHKQQSVTGGYYGHMHTIKPISQQDSLAPVAPPPASPVQAVAAQPSPVAPPVNNTPPPPVQNAPASVTPAPQTAILQLASNDDLNVATLAREAERSAPQDEVVIKLH